MLGALLSLAVLAGPTPPDSTSLFLNAHRLAAGAAAPTLDGRLDDAAWAAADSSGGFIQRDPDEGKPASFPTVVRVAFDDAAVYVALRAYDPEPGKVTAQLTRRDQDSSSDWLMVAFDSRHDLRTAYAFAVNPAGVKRDFIVADGSGDDAGWDAVWESAVHRDAHGWTAELRIPLAALRFTPGGDGVWGFEAIRIVARTHEQSFWAPLRRDDSRTVARFGQLRGLRGLPSPRRLELLPYTVSGVTRAPGQGADPFYAANAFRGSAGLDLKYGVTSDLTLDATVNPDFGQVEADPSQVNLSQYESFYAEKRPFFTEGADIFRFGLGLGDGDDANEALFYSRRIGRSPHGELDGEFVSQPGQTTILGAAKLSGRVGGGWSVGMLTALTAEERGRAVGDDASPVSRVVEPMTGYGVFRARRDMRGGRTQLGFVGTGVHRALSGTEMDDLPGDAYAGGVDFVHRFGSDAWLAQGYLLGSTVHGSADAILDLQQSPARYYQRPDGHLRVDSAATALRGWAGGYTLARVKGRWQGGVLGIVRSPGFEVNDVGYQREADQVTNAGYFQFRQFTPVGPFRRFNLSSNAWDGRTFGGQLTSRGGNLNGSATLKSYWGFYGGVDRELAAVSTSALRGGPSIRRPGRTSGWMGVYSDDRKPLNGELSYEWGREDQSGGRSWSTSLSLNWRPTASTTLKLGPFYSSELAGWQYVDAPADELGGTHYLFSRLRQETVGVSARFDQTFTPTLSLQLYAQPFISAGRYGGFMEVADPHAARFGDRFRPLAAEQGDDGELRLGGVSVDNPDFDYRAFNLNAVLRWEYRLGSTMYFAWSHTRDGSVDDGRFRLWHDLDALYGYKPTNVFLVKVNWWVNL